MTDNWLFKTKWEAKYDICNIDANLSDKIWSEVDNILQTEEQKDMKKRGQHRADTSNWALTKTQNDNEITSVSSLKQKCYIITARIPSGYDLRIPRKRHEKSQKCKQFTLREFQTNKKTKRSIHELRGSSWWCFWYLETSLIVLGSFVGVSWQVYREEFEETFQSGRHLRFTKFWRENYFTNAMKIWLFYQRNAILI